MKSYGFGSRRLTQKWSSGENPFKNFHQGLHKLKNDWMGLKLKNCRPKPSQSSQMRPRVRLSEPHYKHGHHKSDKSSQKWSCSSKVLFENTKVSRGWPFAKMSQTSLKWVSQMWDNFHKSRGAPEFKYQIS